MSMTDSETDEEVFVVVYAKHGALQKTEVYSDSEPALHRYAELASDNPHEKTMLSANIPIRDELPEGGGE